MNSTDRNESFSYFNAPISNTMPLMDVNLDFVYNKVKSDELKEKTLRIRADKASKDRVLPYITVSGCFSKLNADRLISYSSLICIDLDDCPVHRKSEFADDQFLKPVMIFISPRAHGLKVIVRVSDGVPEDHPLYYEAIAHYFQGAYGVTADPACKNVASANFLCWDSEVFYRNEGSVSVPALLRLLPPQLPASAKSPLVRASLSGSPGTTDANTSSTGVPVFGKPTATEEMRPSDLLNRDPRVHERAVAALKADGWVQINDDLWRRPGKNGGNSAIYNYFDREGIYFFTNFSSNSPHFIRKGYTDTMLISEIEFQGSWDMCIAELANQYL